MRRKDREVRDFAAIVKVIDECDIIRLGFADKDYPYIVPVNFAYIVEGEQVCFYIHGAKAGRKYELMQKNKCCSFEMDIPLMMECIVEKKDVTMRYKCVMGKADIEFIDDTDEKIKVLDNIIMARYDKTRSFDYNIPRVPDTAIVRLVVTEISCKINPIASGED